MRREEALSPVVAVMLILAIAVTFYALVNATVIPQLKEQSEIEHLERVKEAFMRFDSDLRLAIAMERGVVLKERIPLGGGDILVNTVKSGGTLRVQGMTPAPLEMTIDENESLSAGMVQVSYQPVSNFWQEQGYTWQYGYLNVTKRNGRVSTPLEYPRMEDIDFGEFANALLSLDRDTSGACTLRYANLVAGASDFASGSGVAALALDSEIERHQAGASVNLSSTGAGAPEVFEGLLSTLGEQCGDCSNILACSYDGDTRVLAIQTTGMDVIEQRIAISAG